MVASDKFSFLLQLISAGDVVTFEHVEIGSLASFLTLLDHPNVLSFMWVLAEGVFCPGFV